MDLILLQKISEVFFFFLALKQESFQRLLQEESQKNEKKALDLLEDEKQRHKVG